MIIANRMTFLTNIAIYLIIYNDRLLFEKIETSVTNLTPNIEKRSGKGEEMGENYERNVFSKRKRERGRGREKEASRDKRLSECNSITGSFTVPRAALFNFVPSPLPDRCRGKEGTDSLSPPSLSRPGQTHNGVK